MLPLASSVELATGTFLLLTLVGGVAFGVVLERAGFGSGCKLTAVFYGYDMSVVKVMFTAIVTAMAGLWLLASIGVIDMQEIYIVPTNYAAQLVGGLVFGAGFVIGGYCPGTAVVACAAGRADAWAFALGILAGIAVYARFMGDVEQWIRANAIDDVTLPSLTGIAAGWGVALFVVFLALAAWGMGIAERAFARLKPVR
jgi:uncharacterized membrane protein YedE/YeeE